jgi:hypothetical protein
MALGAEGWKEEDKNPDIRDVHPFAYLFSSLVLGTEISYPLFFFSSLSFLFRIVSKQA